MNCVFWNVGKKKVNDLLINLIEEFNCHLISIAEYNEDKNDLLRKLQRKGYDFYHLEKIGCQRIDIFSVFKPGEIKPLSEETSYFTFKSIPHKTLGRLVFSFVHFPSKLHMSDVDYLVESTHLKNALEKVEQDVGSNLTVMTGDFNMNPFEMGMMTTAGLHAYSTKLEANMLTRTVKKREYNTLFNPMWNFFGDKNSPSGTYYYPKAEHLHFYWNIFDQVIIRPSLIEHLDTNEIKIITKIGNTELINDKGIPKVSDHLPLYFTIM